MCERVPPFGTIDRRELARDLLPAGRPADPDDQRTVLSLHRAAAVAAADLLVSMPDGYRLPPHFQPGFEHVEVKEGKLLAGMGDRIDPARTHALSVGDSATAPAGMRHFSIASGHTVLAVTFIGPYTITYLRAEDAPQRSGFPFGY